MGNEFQPMESDPTDFSVGKELVHRDRLLKGEDDQNSAGVPVGVFLDLWLDQHDRRVWAISIMDDYRAHLGDGIHIQISDGEAGWLKRIFAESGSQ